MIFFQNYLFSFSLVRPSPCFAFKVFEVCIRVLEFFLVNLREFLHERLEPSEIQIPRLVDVTLKKIQCIQY